MTDLQIINEIEKIINTKLEVLKEFSWHGKGYILNYENKVTQLSLERCDIDNAKEKEIFLLLEELSLLQHLDLSINKIEEFPQMSSFVNLKKLCISQNRINNINHLRKLTQLTMLDIHSNPIEDLSALHDLHDLTHLSAHFTYVEDIGPLSSLDKLSVLYLSAARISDITPIKYLNSLSELYLRKNYLSNISALANLTNLTNLDLGENSIKDIECLKELRKLKILSLIKNPIQDLPQWITRSNLNIRWQRHMSHLDGIYLYDNPLRNIDPEIMQMGEFGIEGYFKQLKEQKQDYLFEAKLLFLGNAGAGKTTAARKLTDPSNPLPKEDEVTKGIEVSQYYFPIEKYKDMFEGIEDLESRQFRLNIWDFGGQEIYISTHRFFLTKRSLYLIVAENRKQDTDFIYWLQTVEMFGGDAPIFIVINEKIDCLYKEVDFKKLKEKFTNIKEIFTVNFSDDKNLTLNKIRQNVRHYATHLPHIGNPVPATWKIIREQLDKHTASHITFYEYTTICRSQGLIKLNEILLLSRYFHDIGVFLHFQEDELLNKMIFLKSTWATNAVYKILNDSLLKKTAGRFNKSDAGEIWKEEEFLIVKNELLRLMQRFYLTYEIEDSGEFIVPVFLPVEQPKYMWDAAENLYLTFTYDKFMPRGILSQFIVQMNRYINDHQNVWRKGVVIQRESAIAEVVESYDNKISIRISGKNKRDFMTIISEHIDKINNQYENLVFEKQIPCNCSKCKDSQNPEFYNYKNLIKRLNDSKYEVECEASYELVKIKSLIDEVLSKPKKRNTIFISYAHKDDKWVKKIKLHLQALKNRTIEIIVWEDSKLKAGNDWKNEIREAMAEAKVIISLISTEFLASKFINQYELPATLKAAENEQATIIPIIVSAVNFNDYEKIFRYQTLNSPDKPLKIMTSNEIDKTLLKLQERIEEIFTRIPSNPE